MTKITLFVSECGPGSSFKISSIGRLKGQIGRLIKEKLPRWCKFMITIKDQFTQLRSSLYVFLRYPMDGPKNK